MDADSGWRLAIHNLAWTDLQKIHAKTPELAEAILSALEEIKHCNSPLAIPNRKFSSILSYPHALGCIRVKQWGCEWRVIIRVLDKLDKTMVDARYEKLDASKQYLQVILIDTRSELTYVRHLPARMVALL